MAEEQKRQSPQTEPHKPTQPLIERGERDNGDYRKSITPNIEPVRPWPEPSEPRDSGNKEK